MPRVEVGALSIPFSHPPNKPHRVDVVGARHIAGASTCGGRKELHPISACKASGSRELMPGKGTYFCSSLGKYLHQAGAPRETGPWLVCA